jgi:hypothetical protein
MRRIGLLALCLSLIPLTVACGDDDDDGDDDAPTIDGGSLPDSAVSGDAGGITSGFFLKTPDITVKPGEERTYCWYTTMKLDRDLGVKHWASHMSEGSHHMIVYFTDQAEKPDGTIDEACGGLGGGVNIPVWTYSAQNVDAEMKIPDGVGMMVPKNQALYIQMHYLNTTDADLKVHVELTAQAYEAGVEYIPAAAYVTYNTQINLKDGDENKTFGGTCPVPAGAKFFTLSTHAHKQATHTQVEDAVAPAAKMVFQSDNWEHPGTTDWLNNNYTFESNKLKYSCTYTNHSGHDITEGQSAQTDEMCMAVGYFYPATKHKFCVNSLPIQ